MPTTPAVAPAAAMLGAVRSMWLLASLPAGASPRALLRAMQLPMAPPAPRRSSRAFSAARPVRLAEALGSMATRRPPAAVGATARAGAGLGNQDRRASPYDRDPSRGTLSRMKKFLAQGDVGAARRELERMEARGIPVLINHLNLLAAHHRRTGDLEAAAHVADEISSRGLRWDRASLTLAMTAAARARRWDDADRLFDHHCSRKDVVDDTERIVPDTALFCAMLQEAADLGDPVHADFWFRRMLEHSHEPPHRAHTARIQALVGAGRRNTGRPDSRDVEEAMAVLDEIEAIDWQARHAPRPFAASTSAPAFALATPYLHLMRAHSQLGHPDRVRVVFDRAVRTLDAATPWIVHEAFVDSLCAAGDPAAARAHLEACLLGPGAARPARGDVRPDILAPFLELARSDQEEARLLSTAAALSLEGGRRARPPAKLRAAVVVGRLARGEVAAAQEYLAVNFLPADHRGDALDPRWAIRILQACEPLEPASRAVAASRSCFDLMAEADPGLKSNTAVWTALLRVTARDPPG
ncbi:hypothetical protein HK405_011735, partial [Cladochytrium tenue]